MLIFKIIALIIWLFVTGVFIFLTKIILTTPLLRDEKFTEKLLLWGIYITLTFMLF